MKLPRLLRLAFATATALSLSFAPLHAGEPSAEKVFLSPPPSARPAVMWMWMGSNITPASITNDLEKLRDACIGGTLVFSLATSAPLGRANRQGPHPRGRRLHPAMVETRPPRRRRVAPPRSRLRRW